VEANNRYYQDIGFFVTNSRTSGVQTKPTVGGSRQREINL